MLARTVVDLGKLYVTYLADTVASLRGPGHTSADWLDKMSILKSGAVVFGGVCQETREEFWKKQEVGGNICRACNKNVAGQSSKTGTRRLTVMDGLLVAFDEDADPIVIPVCHHCYCALDCYSNDYVIDTLANSTIDTPTKHVTVTQPAKMRRPRSRFSALRVVLKAAKSSARLATILDACDDLDRERVKK